MSSVKRSIGLVLGGHLGDVILYSSILKPIRETFPTEEIILIASPPAMELFGESPYIDRAVDVWSLIVGPWPRFKVANPLSWARITRCFWAPSLVVDTLIFPYYFVSSYYLSLVAVIKHREVIACVGGPYLINKRRIRSWENRVTKPIPVQKDFYSVHVFNHIADFLTHLGGTKYTSNELRVELVTKDTNDSSIASLVAPFAGHAYGVIFPSGKFKRHIKVWPVDRYGDVVRLLRDSGPSCWLVCGTLEEREECRIAARSISRVCPDVQTSVVCGEPLHHIAATVKNAKLAVGIDNGGMHLAVAAGIPAVSIVGGMVRNLYFPWGDPEIHRAVMLPMDCWDCRYSCIHSKALCIENIIPQAVADECRSVLDIEF